MSDTGQVSVFSWHFMPWPYLDENFDRDHGPADAVRIDVAGLLEKLSVVRHKAHLGD